MKPVVTAEQIGKCHRFITGDGRDIWGVESEGGTLDVDGNIVEYCVRLDVSSCSCPDFAKKKGASCKHLKWARAASLERQSAFAAIDQEIADQEEQLHKLSVNGQCPSQAVATRILTAKASPVVKDIATSQITSNRGFCLMR